MTNNWVTVWAADSISLWDERPDSDAYVGVGLFVAVSLLDEALAAKERAEAERDEAIGRNRIDKGHWLHAEAEVIRLTAALAVARAERDEWASSALGYKYTTTEPAKAEEQT